MGLARTEGPKYTRVGSLVIPVQSGLDDADRPGWIVDGQQRIAAIRAAHIDSFPICVVAFITGDEQEQREQFILVNSASSRSQWSRGWLHSTVGAQQDSFRWLNIGLSHDSLLSVILAAQGLS